MADLKENNQTTKKEVREFFKMGEVFGYFFRKKDPTRPTNFNIRVMHAASGADRRIKSNRHRNRVRQ